MRRKVSTVVAVLLVWLMVASSSLAFTIDDTAREVYADGDSIEITGDGAGTNTVKSSSDQQTYNGSDYTIYGGRKNADVTGNTSVTIGNGATVGDVYGGGNDGDVNGNTNVTINGGTVEGDVYGGGHATAAGNEKETANVTGNTSVTVSDGTVNGDVYGGGNAEATAATNISLPKNAVATANAGDASVGVGEDGTINGDVYGGGKSEVTDKSLIHSASATANVGNTTVTVEGQADDVYGGGESGNVGGSTDVTVAGGHVRSVHGGGNKGNVSGSTKVTVDNAEVTGNVYGGGHEGNVGSTSVTVKNSTVSGSVYGGGHEGNVQGMAKVSIIDGTISDSVYGGGYAGYVQGLAQVEIANGTISGSVYGGGYAGDVAQSNIIISGENTQINSVYGGGHGKALASANAGQTRIELNDGSVGTIYAGSQHKGYVASSQMLLNGGSVTTGEVFGWGDGFLFGGSLLTQVTSTQIILSQLSARDYTFYLPIGTCPSTAIVRNGDLRWDGVTATGISFWDLVLLPYKLTQPADRQVTAITKFIGPNGVVKTIPQTWTIPAGPAVRVTPASWSGDGAYNVGVASPEYQMVDYDDTGDVTFEVPVTPISKDIKVTFKYMYGSETDPRHTDVQWAKGVTNESGSQTLTSSWDGGAEFNDASGSQTVDFSSASELVVPIRLTATVKDVKVTFNYTYDGVVKHTEVKEAKGLTFESADQTLTSSWDGGAEFENASGSKTVDFNSDAAQVVNIELTPTTKDVKVTFNYTYGGVVKHTEVKEAKGLTFESAEQTLTSSWDGGAEFNDASGSKTVGFNSEAALVVNIALTPSTRTIYVMFNYLYRGGIVHTEQIPASVTYDAAPVSVTPTWDGEGEYIIPAVEPTSVGFEYQGQTMTINIDVRRVNTGDDEQTNIPLGPGTQGTDGIPLGLPRTGGADPDLLSALLFAGATLTAALRRRAK